MAFFAVGCGSSGGGSTTSSASATETWTEADSFDDPVAAVNDSCYGLSAAILTRSLGCAHRFAGLADVGQVAVCGFRESGSAFKEQGLGALRFYTRTKTIAVHYGS